MDISKHAVAQIVLMDRGLDRAESELRAFVDRLSEDEQAELVALMWIGRGSFDAEEFEEAVTTARAQASTPCADYLIGTPNLSDHLETALDAMGHSLSEDEDELMGRV